MRRWSYPSIVNSADRAIIDGWISEAPDYRKVETEPLEECVGWRSRAIEDGELMFEELEEDAEKPLLHELAAWCGQHTKRAGKPPVKVRHDEESAPLPLPSRISGRVTR
jgi:hypothetical protein